MPMLMIALAFAAQWATLNVTVVHSPGMQPADSLVLAEPVGQSGTQKLKETTTRATNGRALLNLAPGVWIVRATTPDRWCWPVQVFVQPRSAPTDVTLVLSPLGTVTGALKAVSPPGELNAYVDRSVQPATFTNAFKGEPITCPVKSGRWACRIPADMPVDLRIDAPGFGPRYLWRITVPERDSRETGTLELFRGASVTGWVLSPSGIPPKTEALVELRAPAGGPIEPEVKEEALGLRFTGRTDAHGFFQVGPTPPGVYHLTVHGASAVSRFEHLHLQPEREEKLRSPVILTPPVTLRISIDPPQSPGGDAWRIALFQRRGLTSGQKIVNGAEVPETGQWSKANMPAGEYQFMLMTKDGSVWHSEALDLQPDNDQVTVNVQPLRVVGSLSVGSTPLPGARLKLSERKSGAQILLSVDESGAFAGHLPSVELESAAWAADVMLFNPKVRHTLTGLQPERLSASEIKFVLRLVEGGLDGKVVDENGTPQSAAVYATRVVDDSRRGASDEGAEFSRTQAQTEESTGRFSFVGLAAGSYRINAMGLGQKAAPEFRSDVSTVRVDPDSRGGSTVLVLKRVPTISGRVLTGVGTGIAGATTSLTAPPALDLLTRPVATDPEGRFVAYMPASESHFSVTVEAIGIGRRTLGGLVPASGDLDVVLDATGGTLVLDFGDLKGDDISKTAQRTFFQHDGGIDSVVGLKRWSEVNGEEAAGSLLRAPLMSPGFYRVCQIVGLAEVGALMANALPKDRCRGGYLPPGGELQLQVPTPTRTSRDNSREVN